MTKRHSQFISSIFFNKPLRRIARVLVLTLLISIFSPLTVQKASAAQGTECVIGASETCPATSPQEIYNLYGTTADGTYWVKVNGVARQVYLLMNRTNSDNGAWILMMKGAPSSETFVYSSAYWTNSTSTLNTTSLSNDVNSDAKFSVFNDLSVKKMLAVFKPGGSSGAYAYVAGTNGIPIGGDIADNAFGGHVWLETLATASTAQARLTTNGILYSPASSIPISKYRQSSSASSSQVFSYETPAGVYGFNVSTCTNSAAYLRWGFQWNENGTNDYGSCDMWGGIGGTFTSANDSVVWNGAGCGNVCVAPGTSMGHKNLSFQIWGKVADPSLAAPTSLTAASPSAGQVNLLWSAPPSVTAVDYVVQYKTAAASGYSNSFIVSGQTSASITGLTDGTSYNFRVFARTASDSTSSANISGSTITAVPQRVPAAPSITGITGGNTTLSVAFNSPSTDGGATITSYQYSTDGGSNWRTRDSGTTASPLVINTTSAATPVTLANGTSYNVQIRAVNSVGNGAATSSTTGTTTFAACSPVTNPSPPAGYTVLTFTSTTTCNWSVPTGVTVADILVVGGGGGGGDSNSVGTYTGGAGGAGGFFSASNVPMSGSITVSVGVGGAGAGSSTTNGTSGGDSAFGTLKVGGGGYGNSVSFASSQAAGSGVGGSGYVSGGSGGGGRSRGAGDNNAKLGGSAGAIAVGGVVFQGNTYTGLAGAAGSDAWSGDFASGGPGGAIIQSSRTSSISGASVIYSKGGTFRPWNSGSNTDAPQTYGSGGATNYNYGSAETAGNTLGGDGAQGVVIVKYVNAPSITLSSNAIAGTANSAITSYSITNSGGAATSYSISPALSTAGLSFSTSTGLISGTPTATLASTSYTITATNSSGTSTATFTLTVSLSCAAGGVCVVGDTGPGGGKVFYVAPGGGTFACGQSLSSLCKYLEAAPITGASAWTDNRYAWSGNINTAIGSTSTAIGTGYSNTLKMVRQVGAGTAGAGSAARGYRGGGLNDWYLPSKDELNQITINQALLSATAGYWSSSEATATGAWDQGSNGAQGVADPGKQQTTPVRPIRAFGSSAIESAIIYVPAIAGVTAPVRGATPVTTVTAANGYTGTVTWSGTPSTFAAGTSYTATITLSAASGFTLTGVTANFFTVTGATSVTHSADSGTITAVFPATETATQTITQTSTSPSSTVVAGTYTPTATASSGLTVAITIASGSSSICSISGGLVTFNAVGSCVIQYNQAGNATYAAASQVTETLTIGKGSQTITFGSLSNKTLGSGTYSISATSSSSLTVAFTSATTSVCTVATTTITLVAAGTCTINANQAGDSNYLAATQVQQSFTVAAALSITTPSGASLQGTYNTAFTSLTISSSGGAGSKTFAASGSLPTGLTLSAGVISGTPSVTGDYSLTITVTDANGATATTSSFTISIAKGPSNISITVPAYTFTGSPQGPDSVTTSGSTGTVTYAYVGRGSTTYASSSTKPTNTGTYTVTATVAADSNFASASASADFQISDASLVITPTISASSMPFGTSGASLPTISYTKNPNVSLITNPTCALYLASDTGFVTAQTLGSTLAADSYVVRCTGAAATNYTITYDTNPSFTVTKLDITLTVGTPASTPYTGSSVSVTNTFTRTSGTLAGSDAISGMTYTYTSAGGYNSTTAPTAGGNYTITGSSAIFSTGNASNYTITYVAGALTITTATQTVTWAPSTALSTTDSPATPSSLATALGSATISYAVTSAGTTGCTVNSSTAVLTFTAAGSCQVTATAAATSNYATASTPVTFVISLPTYAITLAAGTNGSGSNQTLTKTSGVSLTLPNSATANGYFTRAGYSVSGWSTTNLGSQSYALGGSFTTDAVTTLYPVWTAVTCSPTSSVAFGYTIYRFTTVGTCFWTVPNGLTNVEILAVAGGGGGGYSWGNSGAGGGGGGQVKTTQATLSATLEVTVGAGGSAGIISSGRGGSGGDSIVSTITALGGTGGCGLAAPTCSDASMATATAAANGGAGAASPGNGTSGKGGGGSSLTLPVTGTDVKGQGTSSDYSGSALTYGYGGTGGSPKGSSTNVAGAAGGVNTGNGGDGAATNSASNGNSSLGANGGAGGSGVVIVRYGNTLTITYDAKGGTTASGGSTTTVTGGTVSTLPTTSRTGYTFNGWFTSATGGTQITTSAAHNFYGNFTLYAQWSANALTITYDSQSGSAISNGSTTTGGSISASPGTPSRDGYTFNGWFAASTSGTAIVFPYTHRQTADFTLYAQWTVNTYTITYKAGTNGTGIDLTQSFTFGNTATLKDATASLTRTGYVIAGWSTSDGGSQTHALSAAYSSAADLLLYPVWSVISYTITFDANGATGGTTASVAYGSNALTSAPTLSRTDYSFAGWSESSTGSVIASWSVVGTKTLYAIWTPAFVVTFVSAGSAVDPLTYTGTTLAKPTDPSRTGYSFAGWKNPSDTTIVWSYTPTASITLTAAWTINTYIITITQSANGSISPTSATVNYGTDQLFTFTPATGYSVASITVDGTPLSSSALATAITSGYTFTNVIATHTITAAYSLNSYIISVTQSSNGSISPTSATVNYGSDQLFTFTPATGYSVASITVDGTELTSSALTTAITSGYTFSNVITTHTITATYSLNFFTITFDANGSTGGTTASVAYGSNALTSAPNLSRTDYSFAGWSDSSSGAVISTWNVVGTKTLYAIWTPAFVVTFVSAGTAVDPLTYTGSALAKPTDPSRTGYTFAGWKNPSNATVTWSYTPTASITLTAAWNLNTYIITITQSANGSISPTSATVDYGTDQLFTFTPATGYSVASITVDGTELTSSALTTAITSGYSFTNVTAVHTITATFTLNTYTITFDANGATGGTTASVSFGSNAVTSAPNLSRTDYSFAGWSETSSGAIITTWNVVGTKTLYAIWTPAFVVTFVSAGTAVAPVTYTTTALAKPTNPTRTGYSFVDWKDASNNVISWPFTPTASITLTAGWSINTYLITITQTSNGSISPTSATVNYGSDQLFTFTPATGFFVASITVDGSALSSAALATAIASGYSFTNVTATHSITATYAAIVYRVTLESPRATVAQAIIDYTVGSEGIILPYRIKADYVFLGWYTQVAGGGTQIGIAGARYTPTSSVTLYSHWIQETLYGIDPAKLTLAGDIRASSSQTRTLLVEAASSSVSVRVPAGALPEGTFVEIYSLSTDEYSRSKVTADGDFIVNLVVAWHTAEELVPVATTPIVMTVRNSTIKKGADVYAIQGQVVKKLATATVDGEVVVLISEDPIITVTNPVEAITNPTPPTQPVAATGGGGGGGPKLTAIYFQLVDPFDPTKIYTKAACLDIYSRTVIPQFMGTACSSNDGRINILVADAKISVRVYELGNGSIYREYVGVVENDTITVDDSKYFGSTTRWIVNVSPNQSITSPQGDIKNVEDAQTQADRIIADAKKQAIQILETARNEIKTLTDSEATKILDAATAKAAKILDDANLQAERLLADIKAAAAAAAAAAATPKPTPTPPAPVVKPTPVPTTPVKVAPKVVTISCKKGNLVKTVKGASPKCPTGYTLIKAITAKPAPKTITITCAKGALSRKVTGTKPVCPAGFVKKS